MRVVDLSSPLVDVLGLALTSGLLALQFRQRRVRVRSMWVIPVVVLVLSVLSVSHNPPAEVSGWAWLGLGFVVGLSIGIARAALTNVHDVDLSGGVMLVRSSAFGVLVWLAAFALRSVVRQLVASSGPDSSTAGLVSEALLMVALGTVLANASVLYRTYRSATVASPPGSSSSSSSSSVAVHQGGTRTS